MAASSQTFTITDKYYVNLANVQVFNWTFAKLTEYVSIMLKVCEESATLSG